jgi:predicted ATPase
MARLDQTAPMKAVAQAAAVIGREFSLEVLEIVASLSRAEVQAAVDRLLAAGLLFRGGYANPNVYAFKHALVQDEAYASLLRDERRTLHARIGEALCRRFPAQAEAAPEVVAHHYTEAGKPQLALEYWLRAGRQATMRSAFVEAATHCQIALKILAELPEGRARDELELDLQHSLGRALIAARGFGAAETKSAFERALALCRRYAGSPQTFAVVAGVIGVRLMRGEFEQCRDLAEELLAQVLQQDDPTPKLMAHRALGMSLFVLGELIPAREHLQRALDLYDTAVHAPLALVFSQDFKATAQIYLALTAVLQGDINGGVAHGHEALTHAEHLRHPHSICYVLPFLAGAYLICREPQLALPIAERTMVLSAEYEFPLWSAGGLMLRGWAHLDLGDVPRGLAELRQSVAALDATDTLIWVQFARYLLARALATAGQDDEALDHVDQILTRIGGTSGRWYEPEVHRLKGDLVLGRGDAREAEACYERAIAVAARQGARLWQLRATNAVSALWRQQGRLGDVQARLAPLSASFGAETRNADLRQARELLAEHA